MKKGYINVMLMGCIFVTLSKKLLLYSVTQFYIVSGLAVLHLSAINNSSRCQ